MIEIPTPGMGIHPEDLVLPGSSFTLDHLSREEDCLEDDVIIADGKVLNCPGKLSTDGETSSNPKVLIIDGSSYSPET